jgi:hypothetical protein
MLLPKLFSRPSLSPTRLLIAASLSTASVFGVAAPASAACQAGDNGCVLPIGIPAPVEAAPVILEEGGGGGIGLLPILLGLAALAALLWLLLDDDDDDEVPITP